MNLVQRSILLVDDEPLILDLLKSFLSELNLNIYLAEDGKKAIEILDQHEIHGVISDIAMPNLDGFGLLTEIKTKYQHVPTVMLTAFGDRENVLQALRLGAIDFLEKPFKEQEVIDVTIRLLDIGIRLKNILFLQSAEATGEENEDKVRKLEHHRKMIGLLTVKGNQDHKRSNEG